MMLFKTRNLFFFCFAACSSLFSAQISEKANFIYFAVPKVGSTTVHAILGGDTFKPIVQMTHLPLEKYNWETHHKYFKFAFVRNPWDRVVSCYFNKVVTRGYPKFKSCFGKSFTYFVRHLQTRNLDTADCHIRKQSRFFPSLDEMDFIGHIENFSEDFQHLLYMLGLDEADIPKKNSTSHAHYSSYYTEETRDIVAELYKEDIETFGYTFETL